MRTYAAWMLMLSPAFACAQAEPAPALMLANQYHAEIDLADYWVSEKYDGIRAFWSGEFLLTRSGHRIAAPQWFVSGWPSTPMDGELWIARGTFEELSATVRDAVPDDSAWKRVKFMVFDLPTHGGYFSDRLNALSALLEQCAATSLERVQQWRVNTEQQLLSQLDTLTAKGAEGLMLHRSASYYHAERSDDLLKLKPHRDAEAKVVGYLPGKGKYAGLMGALKVVREDGLEFHLGTGFTDEQRRHPPRIGERVTYSFHGVTARGVPRFARFVRTRDGDD
jgi:DNA ligase-1